MSTIHSMRGFYVGTTMAAAITRRATARRLPWSAVASRESVGTYLVLEVKQAQRTDVRAQIGARRTTDDAVD